MPVGFTVRSRRRAGHGFPSLNSVDPCTGIPLSPGPPRRSRRHRSSAPARNSNYVAEDDGARADKGASAGGTQPEFRVPPPDYETEFTVVNQIYALRLGRTGWASSMEDVA